MGKKESIEDTARVLGRMYDGIEYRGFEQAKVEELAAKAGVPVWNGLTTEFHPTQVLADILTMREEFGEIKGRKLTFLVRRPETSPIRSWSFALSSALTTVLAAQSGKFGGATSYDPELLAECSRIAAEHGSTITITEDIEEGARDADVIYTDVWVGMGQPAELWESRIKLMSPYRVTAEVMSMAKPGRFSSTAFRASTILILLLVPKLLRSLELPKWKSRTRFLSPISLVFSKKRRIACIRLRR